MGATLTVGAGLAHLSLVAAEGHHLAPDAPAAVQLTWSDATSVSVQALSARFGVGWPLGPAPFGPFSGSLRYGECSDADGSCRIVTVDVRGVVADGLVALLPAEAATPWRADADGAFRSALDAARAAGRPLLIDFSAIWCPPCNRLAHEVLEATPRPPILDRVDVVVVDVDDPSSWTVKDAYNVGSYPTVVVVDGSGAERGRTVGFDGREEFEVWLTGVLDGAVSTPAEATPLAAAEEALRRARDGREAGPWLRRAESGHEGEPALRLARALAEASPDDAQWLVKNAPAAYWAELAHRWPDRAARAPAVKALRDAYGVAGDSLAVAEALEVLHPAERALWQRAQLAILRERGVGEGGHAYWTAIASLAADIGDVSGALAELDARPWAADDPTPALTGSTVALMAERNDEALARAQRGLEFAWGDQRLRLATTAARALTALGRADEAQALAQRVLAEVPAPPADVMVRTDRYRRALIEASGLPPETR